MISVKEVVAISAKQYPINFKLFTNVDQGLL